MAGSTDNPSGPASGQTPDQTQRVTPPVRKENARAGPVDRTAAISAKTAALPVRNTPSRAGHDAPERQHFPIPTDLPPVLGPYRLEALLGEGGMGRVLLAKDDVLDRPVAIKILSASLASDKEFAARFLNEARSVAKLQHENVVAIHFAGRQDNISFFAMQYVDGTTVDDLLERDGPFAWDRALNLLRQAASGLGAAFAQGIIHRDVKPSNLIVDSTDHLRVVDFGLAKDLQQHKSLNLTTTGTILGTPTYLSPEQGRGEPPTHRSDMYSLGVTFYSMLAGRPPFEGDTPLAVIHKHVSTPPPPLESFRMKVPKAVNDLLARLLAKEPADRFANYGDLIGAIDVARASIAPVPSDSRSTPAPGTSGAPLPSPLVASGSPGTLDAPVAPEKPQAAVAGTTAGPAAVVAKGRAGLWEEARDITFRPGAFFEQGALDRSLGRALVFQAGTCLCAGALVHLIAGLPVMKVAPGSFVMVTCVTALTFALARLLGGRGSYRHATIVEAYASPLLAVAFLPLHGPGGLLKLASFALYARTRTVGLSRAHAITTRRALVVALPWLLLALHGLGPPR